MVGHNNVGPQPVFQILLCLCQLIDKNVTQGFILKVFPSSIAGKGELVRMPIRIVPVAFLPVIVVHVTKDGDAMP